jgi:dihydroflavonol-4-reductase
MILVTGGTGLLGSHLLPLLVREHGTVKALYRNTHPPINGVEWVQANILDIVLLQELFQQVTQVYHCAGMVSFNPGDENLLYKMNVEGTANVVNACLEAGVQKLLFVSSVAALGRIREDGPINETMNWTPETSNSTYGKTKFLAEMEVWRGMGEGLKTVIINPVIILGAANWNTGSTGIFKSAFNQFPWYTNGVSGFVDVLDVVQAMHQLMQSNIVGERFIVSGHNLPYKTVFTLAANAFNKKPPHKLVTPLLAEIVWRIEWIKGKLTGKKPLLTKETAKTAQAKVYFDNRKLLEALPNFQYTPIEKTIPRIAAELHEMFKL